MSIISSFAPSTHLKDPKADSSYLDGIKQEVMNTLHNLVLLLTGLLFPQRARVLAPMGRNIFGISGMTHAIGGESDSDGELARTCGVFPTA